MVHVSPSLMGIASGQQVNRSTTVSRYLKPWDSGSGPTRSMWTWSKCLAVGSNWCKGALVCVWTFDLWQFKHVFAQYVTCLFNPCQTNLVDTSFLVTLAPGWDKVWTVSKTLRLQASGTMGLAEPVETSHSTENELFEKGTSLTLRFVIAVR